MSGLFWIQTVWHSDNIPERIFQKHPFWKKISRRQKRMQNFPIGKVLMDCSFLFTGHKRHGWCHLNSTRNLKSHVRSVLKTPWNNGMGITVAALPEQQYTNKQSFIALDSAIQYISYNFFALNMWSADYICCIYLKRQSRLQQTTNFSTSFRIFEKKNKVWYCMRIVCQQTILMKYHALFFFLKNGKIWNCRLLQIIGFALSVNTSPEDFAMEAWPWGYITFSMLNSAEHKIYLAQKC